MNLLIRSAFLAGVAFVACIATKAAEPDRIVIAERPDVYELTVPVSRLRMTIPKKGFLPGKGERAGGATVSRRYFQFGNAADRVILSGWFEAQDEFPGLTEFWKGETAAWSQNRLPQPVDVSIKKLGGWDVIAYRIPPSAGSSTHLRAHWLEAGTWIDLHLSVHAESSAKESLELLESLLARITVTKK